MFKVYLDDKLIYHPNLPELSLETAVLKQELNKTCSFDFRINQKNQYYGSIKKMQSIVKIYEDKRRIFRGRVYSSQDGFHKQKDVKCEGELSFLNDSIQRPYKFEGSVADYFALLINAHNSQVDEFKRFKVGQCTVTDPNDLIVRSDSEYPKTWKVIEDKLIKKLGGYIITREEPDGIYIDYLKDFESLNEQNIEYALNLLDFTDAIKGSDLATAIIPLGAKLKDESGQDTDERLTIKEVNNQVDYVSSPEAVAKYGLIYKVVKWDDVTLAENLLRKANQELQKCIHLTQNLKIKAVDLNRVDKDIRSFRIGCYVKVVSKAHDLNELLLVRKLEINLLDPKAGFLNLGDERKTFTDKSAEMGNDLKDITITEGKPGKDAAIISPTEPTDKTQLWCDTSVNPPLLKQWNGEQWVIVNDNAEDIVQIYQDISSQIQKANDKIMFEVGENTYVKAEVDKLIAAQNTRLTQTENSFNFEFSNFQRNLDGLTNDMNAKFTNQEKYIRFVDGEIWLGVKGNPIMLRQRNDRISFLENDVEVAYISNNTMFITKVEITKELKIGLFALKYLDSGYLPLQKVE